MAIGCYPWLPFLPAMRGLLIHVAMLQRPSAAHFLCGLFCHPVTHVMHDPCQPKHLHDPMQNGCQHVLMISWAHFLLICLVCMAAHVRSVRRDANCSHSWASARILQGPCKQILCNPGAERPNMKIFPWWLPRKGLLKRTKQKQPYIYIYIYIIGACTPLMRFRSQVSSI